jgi:LAO/AO transport system kinase
METGEAEPSLAKLPRDERAHRARSVRSFPPAGSLSYSSIYLAGGWQAINGGNLFGIGDYGRPKFQFVLRLLYTDSLNQEMQSWIERLRSGDVRALARAISTVENRASGWSELLKAVFPHSGQASVIGLTGAPGAGKSTLVDQLARFYRNGKEDARTVGIIAVDPTSPYTGGAILGDRIRMQEHFADAGIYIRSMATRGSLGGLARATADVATVLDVSGRDVILIETVGVGQDEVEVVRLAEVTVVILVPGMGDDVQTIKAGIMEIADIFVINKSDRDGAERVEREILGMQSLATRHDGWVPPIIKTVASNGVGVGDLVAAIENYQAYLQRKNLTLRKRVENWQERLVEMLRDAMLERARGKISQASLAQFASEVAEHKRDPYTLIEEIAAGYNGARKDEMFKIDHLGIAVKSLAAAKAIYQKLGLSVSEEETVAREQVRLAMVPVGESRIELLEATAEDSTIARFIAKRGEGLHHVCLRVPDLTAAVARLKSGGVRLVSEEIGIGAGGHRYVFVHPASAGGVLLELVEGASVAKAPANGEG